MASHALRSAVPSPRWSQERKDRLKRLWMGKRSSGEIASILGGVSRNAVMGMVNRLGLMGRGGVQQVSAASREAVTLLEDLLRVPYDSASVGHDETLVAIAGALHGRDPATIAHVSRFRIEDVERILAAYERAGIWPADSAAPAEWGDDRTGNVSLGMDAMVAAGAAARVRLADGQWQYRAAR